MESAESQNAASRRRNTLAGEIATANRTMKIVIIILLLGVVASLFSGLYFVYKDKGSGNRAVISLTIRVALSILVFVLLISSYYFGWMTDGKL
jgi:heme/copper-type cytochrome/quinol oxidase subunit 4